MRNGEKKNKMPKVPLTIVIPARNEEESIVSIFKEIKKKVKTPHKTLVIVDLVPGEKTHEVVRKYMKEDETVGLILNKSKVKSFANALRLGFNKANSIAVIPVMADMSDRLSDIDKMYVLINKGWDIACGSRYMKGGKKKGGPKLQSFLSKFVCLSLHYIVWVPTKDVSDSFKMYNKNAIKKIYIDPCKGFEISMDITLHAFFKGARIIEIPTVWMGRTKGKSKFKYASRFPKYFAIYSWAIKERLATFTK
ncbi:MAG: glycosyltransferase family 2 protein [Candidatus Levyibacteriota bacterium]